MASTANHRGQQTRAALDNGFGESRIALATVERIFFASLLSLKLVVLVSRWHQMQGFDARWYLEVFEHVDWFAPLPGVRALFVSYHPPLTYFLQRLLFVIYPDALGTSQVLSSASMVLAFVFLRLSLKRLGVLATLPGISFLYLSASLPLCVFLGIESTNEPLVLLFAVLTLYVSIVLLWDGLPADRKWGRREMALAVLLALVLSAGLLTKFTGLFNLLIPFFVVFVRAGSGDVGRKTGVALASCLLCIVLVGPFYYQRYYIPEGTPFPMTIEWLRPESLEAMRRERDAHPVSFVIHLLRLPGGPYWGTHVPVMDSIFHSVWLHLWKRDRVLGPQGRVSSILSDIYLTAFSVTSILGTLLFLTDRRRRPTEWAQLGWILLAIGAVLFAALLLFGYRYPVWDLRIFKAKYIVPAALWISYSTAFVVHHFDQRADASRKRLARTVLACVALFMALNHLVPVY